MSNGQNPDFLLEVGENHIFIYNPRFEFVLAYVLKILKFLTLSSSFMDPFKI